MQRITILLGILLGLSAAVFFLAPEKKEKWVGLQWTGAAMTPKSIDSLQRHKIATLTLLADSTERWVESCQLAQEHGLSVVVLPPTASFSTDSANWFRNYRRHLLVLAQRAQSANADVICVGRNIQNKLSEAQWTALLNEIKQVYSGKLLFVLDWGELNNFRLWDKLDCIGIMLPFRVAADNASKGTQMSHWATNIHRIEKEVLKYQKPIFIFEEHDGSDNANRTIRNQRRDLFFQEVWVRNWASRVFLSEAYQVAD